MNEFRDFGIEIPPGRGGNVKVLCPRCSHTRTNSRDKCLSVDVERGIWKCHHCDWTGSLIPGRDAYGTQPRVYTKPQPPRDAVAPAEYPSVAQFFAGRGIPEEVLRQRDITTSGTAQNPVINFPYYRDGELVNIKHRGRGKKFWMEADAELIFYGLDEIMGEETIIIVEGEMDKLTLDACGIRASVSVPNGAPPVDTKNYSSQFAYLRGAAEEALHAAKTVVIATDMDAPGNRLAEELARRIGVVKCERVYWSEKDANDTLMKHGQDAVRVAVESASPFPVEGMHPIPALRDRVRSVWLTGLSRGFERGWPVMDQLYRPRPGQLCIVTGIPSHGKSRYLDNEMLRLIAQHGWAFGVCSFENQPPEHHLAYLAAAYWGRPFFDGPEPRMSREEVEASLAELDDYLVFILPERPTVENVLELADVAVYRNGIRGLIIDPWNELEHSRPSQFTETEYISLALTKIRNWARVRGVHVWLVAHPTKMQKDSEGKYPVPSLYDISGSANWANKADAGISVWRDPGDPSVPTQIHVKKIRHQETGKVGIAEMLFDAPTGRFRELGQPIEPPRALAKEAVREMA